MGFLGKSLLILWRIAILKRIFGKRATLLCKKMVHIKGRAGSTCPKNGPIGLWMTPYCCTARQGRNFNGVQHWWSTYFINKDNHLGLNYVRSRKSWGTKTSFSSNHFAGIPNSKIVTISIESYYFSKNLKNLRNFPRL